ncbi:WASH complex subunit strumpellin [Folsomia candida]|uniref:WASH complex subunit strumpellin n=1 Tax=Folsomia candida TaxID=158441 RepID=A0A226E238_FOLCA|nr:WASH complex subunit strumpellin [Folsomia candida]
MSDFLADNNFCGQTILRLVSQGNAILADLLRLKETVPSIFRLEHKSDIQKYGEVLCDFSYFAGSEAFEKKLENSPSLSEVDQELRENYIELLSSFYFLFESIFKYVTELNRFIEDVHEGYYIQMSLETILYDKEGKQLLTESLFLYGVMLLLVDIHIDGVVRERMLTSFYRYAAGAFQTETHVDQVCKLFRATGYTKGKRPAGYPQDYFKRVPIDETFVQMIIGVLRSDDIYLQVGSAYPLPEQRSTAFAGQSSMLVIILFFTPMVLHSDNATMREITDKFFPDNWIVPVYMGFFINLVEGWDSFKSAKLALANTVETARVKQITGDKGPKVKLLIEETEKFLKEGLLTEENVLEKVSKVINLLRDCNVTLRWIILHCTPPTAVDGVKKMKQLRDTVLSEVKYDPEVTLKFLLNVAQLELKIKELFRKLLSEKRDRWNNYKIEANERIKELSEVFSGTKPLSRIERNDNLHRWLDTKAGQVDSLNFDEIKVSGRKLVELIRAFDEMLEFHGLESKVQVREWVTEIVACFNKMIRTGSINEDKLVTIQIVEDLGYAWGSIIDSYTPHMQKLIHNDPFAVSKLRAVFLKLSSAMDFPLMRIGQAKSNNLLVNVSSYYSEELVAYVQKVLQIIPESVFSILHKIIELQTNSIQELPTRLDKDKVKEFAQLEDRMKVSRLTHHMSALAEGILMMQTTLVGVIKIDPKKLLENGIRKELVRQVCQVLHTNLNFQLKGSGKDSELMSKLTIIAKQFDGILRSFEYIGDYVNSNGLKIFYEEFSRVLNFFTEQECNSFTKNKVLHFQSIYQSKEIPIPIQFISASPGSSSSPTNDLLDYSATTFLGRLANELISISDPKTSSFLTATSSWYDLKTHAALLTPDYFSVMEKGLGVSGLTGLDKILSFMIANHIQALTKFMRKELTEKNSVKDLLGSLEVQLSPHSRVVDYPLKKYLSWFKIIRSGSTLDCAVILQKIGQLQLLRKRIQYQLRVAASFQAKQLQNALGVVNRRFNGRGANV